MSQDVDLKKRHTLKTLLATAAATSPFGKVVATGTAVTKVAGAYEALTLANTNVAVRRYLFNFPRERLFSSHMLDGLIEYSDDPHEYLGGDWNIIGDFEEILHPDFAVPPHGILVGQIFEPDSANVFCLAQFENDRWNWLRKKDESFEEFSERRGEADWAYSFRDCVMKVSDARGIDLDQLKALNLKEFTDTYLLPEVKKMARFVLEDMFERFDIHPYADVDAGGYLVISDHRPLMDHFPEFANKIEQSVRAWEAREVLNKAQREKQCSNSSADMDVVFIEQDGANKTYEIALNNNSSRVHHRLGQLFGFRDAFSSDDLVCRILEPQNMHREERSFTPVEKIRVTTSVPILQLYFDGIAKNGHRRGEAMGYSIYEPNSLS